VSESERVSGVGLDVTSAEGLRLRFLADVVERESTYLQETDARLFAEPFTLARVAALPTDAEQAERVDAFVARFGRLQDTLGDKLLPALLRAVGEHAGPFIDNLNAAERWGWIQQAAPWLLLRRLRNLMVHEYVSDAVVFVDAMTAAHDGVPLLVEAALQMSAETHQRLR